MHPDGTIAAPVNENFTAAGPGNEPARELGIQQYHGFPIGKYAVELLTLEGSRGTIVARANITLTSPVSATPELLGLIAQNCSKFLPDEGAGMFPSMEDPSARELSNCIKLLAIANNDTEICKGLTQYINNSVLYVDWCLGDYAVNKSDMSLCSKRERATDRAQCRAAILNDWHECPNIADCDFYWSCEQQKDVCLQNFAISRGNETLCRQVQSEEYRNQCLGLVLGDASYCNMLQDAQAKSSCLGYVKNAPPSSSD
jgi:hypothetical protein